MCRLPLAILFAAILSSGSGRAKEISCTTPVSLSSSNGSYKIERIRSFSRNDGYLVFYQIRYRKQHVLIRHYMRGVMTDEASSFVGSFGAGRDKRNAQVDRYTSISEMNVLNGPLAGMILKPECE